MIKRPTRKGVARAFGSGKEAKRMTDSKVYIGPTVEGVDKEYVRVISGKVDDRKPSFA